MELLILYLVQKTVNYLEQINLMTKLLQVREQRR
nr:MAG TPA: hypothetical protein [Caudoviricetes sp.]